MQASEAAACEVILRALPRWFGIEESIIRYRRDLETMQTLVAEVDEQIAGFLTLKQNTAYAAEIQLIAVTEVLHRRGIGRVLVEHSERLLRRGTIEYLQVKTLGPSRPNADYEGTRAFYEKIGFRPLEENNLWGDVNPCLILVKHLRCHDGRETRCDRLVDS
jgi:N-acetylglutamate synthase-like GNAT family acetyltransferase